MLKKRYLADPIARDLEREMAFIGGPRQVGKTTFAKEIIGALYQHPAYFNWDFQQDRRDIVNSAWPAEADLLIFDEIHKYNKWKNLVKGAYDKQKDKLKIIVTGSARLDIFRRGGDSLQGRYHYYRLHPFSLAELLGLENQTKPGAALSFF
jgi:predicted AAA+ superfamily ATPase